ncbi:MAG: Tat pathway signal protein [Sphingorhabdus sp.]
MNRRHLLLGATAAAAAGTGLYLASRAPPYAQLVAPVRVAMAARSDADMRYLVHHAVIAANSHNTQPWLFRTAERHLEIAPDRRRETPVVDPDNHHLFASLGCAAENLSLAALAAGAQANIAFVSDNAGLRVELEPTSPSQDPLFAAIRHRQCSRADYDGRAIDAANLALLEQAAAVPGCRVMLITEKPVIEKVLDLIVAANSVQIEDPAFMRELKSWIRFNASSAAATGDGLYAACSGNPALPSWLGNALFERVVTAEAENAKCVSQIRSSAGMAIFVSEQNDPAHWIQAGRSYQRFALQATLLGLKHAFLNQPVEVARFRPQLAALLGIGDKRPDLVVRFGYGPAMPMSMRRPIADVMTAL